MADRDVAGGILVTLAVLCLLVGLAGGDRAWFVVALFLSLAAAAVLVLAPSRDQRAARRRNPVRQARRVRRDASE